MKNISARIDFEREDFHLRAEFDLPAQGISICLGPSGSGKSTLLRLLAGLEKPQHGYIRQGRTEWFASTSRVNVSPQQRRVGVVFQDYALFSHMTVAENVGYGIVPSKRQATVARWLEQLRLSEFAHYLPHQLSGGQKQRAALARALASEPDLLLMDEPLSAIDFHLRQELRDELRALLLKWAKPVLWITHDLDEAKQCGDFLLVMKDGLSRQQGLLNEVFDRPVSKEIATVLGWRNYLPIKHVNGDFVMGLWGVLKIEGDCDAHARWIAIKPETLRFGKAQDNAIYVTVQSVVDKGPIREVVCQCRDGTVLRAHRPWNEPVPVAGTRTCLIPSLTHVRYLLEDKQLMSNNVFFSRREYDAASSISSQHRPRHPL